MNSATARNYKFVFYIFAVFLISSCGGGGDSSGGSGAGAALTNPDASTYIIVQKWKVQGLDVNFATGTAFSVGDNLLATNAHVVAAVLNDARQFTQAGITQVGVSAFQSQTGDEFPLLEAVVHPAYTGSTKSADVGLFVTRSALPNKLVFASLNEVNAVVKSNQIQVNGFPGDVSSLVFEVGFQPGLTVPVASLFSGTVQALRAFDERKVVTPATTDMWEYSMDTSGGTSGSPVLFNDKVIGVHNSGVVNVVLRPQSGGGVRTDREILATASFGIHLKHLLKLIDEFNVGLLEADKKFRLPVTAELIAAGQGGGQSTAAPGAGFSFAGSGFNPENANVSHQIEISVDSNLVVTGQSIWPENLGLPVRTFTLSGQVQSNGEIEFQDDTPEQIPGFRRGVYTGTVNPASGEIFGQYFEVDEDTNNFIYFGEWELQVQ